MMVARVPVGISRAHVHLSQKDLELLFGKGYQLTEKKALSQPGQFAAEEIVTLTGPKGSITGVRVLGPVRSKTQVEVTVSDCYRLGIQAPVRESGDLEGTPGITIEGPAGRVELPDGVIVAKRHLHLSPEDAEKLGLKDRDIIKVRAEGERALTFENIVVRVRSDFFMDLHLDTDEANAAGLKNNDLVMIIS
ncbi:MAG: phosphate propanoyltransferase [Clostridia bacterium]|nr:phosphate propanoyltransferase [Clostridia bacterium]